MKDMDGIRGLDAFNEPIMNRVDSANRYKPSEPTPRNCVGGSYFGRLARQVTINPRTISCQQRVEHDAGGLQVRSREALGEAIINRGQQCSRVVAATLARPQTGNAEGDPQLPK